MKRPKAYTFTVDLDAVTSIDVLDAMAAQVAKGFKDRVFADLIAPATPAAPVSLVSDSSTGPAPKEAPAS